MRNLISAILPVIFAIAMRAQSLPPSVRVVEPLGPLTLYSLSDSISIRVEASDPDGSVAEVRLLENGQKIAVDLQSPYEFVYRAQTFGNRSLTVEAVDNSGATNSESLSINYVRINDNYAPGLIVNAGTNLTLRGTTVEATRQKGEPNHAGNAGGKSIWWTWRATATGTVILDTVGSDFDTVLAVYTNSAIQISTVSNLVTVASSDDDPANAPLSKVKFTALANQTYVIAVDGRDGFAGNVVLNIFQTRDRAPANDFLSGAARVGSQFMLVSTNVGASKEPGEPSHADNTGGASLWWRLDAPATQPIRISTTGSSIDTLLAVYTNIAGNLRDPQTAVRMDGLRLVASNDDAVGNTNRTSAVEFFPRLGATYWIAVDGYNGAEGTIRLSVSVQQQNFRPTNDQFTAAIRLVGKSALANANTMAATSEFNEPTFVSGKQAGKSVWYRWVAPESGRVYVSTKWSDFDTILGVFAGTNINGLSLVASNDDDGALLSSAVVFNATEGIEYRIGVSGHFGAGGDLVLMLNQPASLLPRIITQVVGRVLSMSVSSSQGPSVLEGSYDLKDWTVIRIVTSEAPFFEIEPTPDTPRQFFRVRQLE
jgi:hypothetical protein